MTVSTLEFFKIYIAAAAQTVFPYPFQILAAADLRIYDNGVLMALGVDYTVSGAGTVAGGNVTFVSGRTAGHTISIWRMTPRTQAVDLEAGQQFYENTIEAMVDKITLILQEFPAAVIPLSPPGYYLRTKADGSGIEAVAVLSAGTALPFDTGTGPPSEGTWSVPFWRFNSAPVAGGCVGWEILEGGTPGTWHEFGFVSAIPV